MKQLALAIVLMAGTAVAQAGGGNNVSIASTPANAPSYSQIYCAGFVSKESVPRHNSVVGGKESPFQERFGSREQIFLGGPGLVAGERYSLLRRVSDSNRETATPEQTRELKKLGDIYEDLGWVTVHSVSNGVAVASFDFSCDMALPGDLVVPFKERPTFAIRSRDLAMDAFAMQPAATRGHILGGKAFSGIFGTGAIVYTDMGSNKGTKPGDYLRVTRGYASEGQSKLTRQSERLPKGAEVTTVDPVKPQAADIKRLPPRVLGEVLILSVTPETSTALVTRSSSEIELGDLIEPEQE